MILNFKFISRALLISSLLSVFPVFSKTVNAGMFLSPMYLKMESEQGQSKGVLQIGNTSAKPIRVRLSTTAFTYNKNGSFQRRSSSEQGKKTLENDLTPYLRYSPQEMVIPGNSSRRVRLISLLPPSLPEGEYRTAIFAETLQEQTNDRGRKMGFNLSIGSALYVAKGDLEPAIDIVKTDFEPKDSKLKLLVANEGDATAKGEVTWTLRQGDKEIASGSSGGSFLPNSQTSITLNRELGEKLDLATGSYQLEGEVVWSDSDEKQTSDFALELQL